MVPNPKGLKKMQFPLSYQDFRLWLAINAIVLLITSELLSYYPGKTFMIEKKRLRAVALILGIIFMVTILIQAYQTSTVF